MTCFGVFWGILMLVLLLGTGSGFKNAMFKSVNGFATNSLFFYADRTSEPYQGFNKGRNWNMRNRDIDAIIRDVPSVQDISPILWGSRSEKNIVYGIICQTYLFGLFCSHGFNSGYIHGFASGEIARQHPGYDQHPGSGQRYP